MSNVIDFSVKTKLRSLNNECIETLLGHVTMDGSKVDEYVIDEIQKEYDRRKRNGEIQACIGDYDYVS